MSTIKNLIFDWSGTLVDDLSIVHAVTNEVFRAHKHKGFTLEEFKQYFFLPYPKFYEKHLPNANIKEAEELYRKHFKEMHQPLNVLPYTYDILRYAQHQGMPIYLLSSIHEAYYKIEADRLNLAQYFKRAIVGVHDKRQAIVELLQQDQLNPAETLFIGDMEHDIAAARHGGVLSCAVLTGYDSMEKLKSAAPDFLFKDLSGVLGYLKRPDEVHHYLPIPTVGALIRNPEGKLLMIQTHKWSNHWGIPGGKIKPNETAEDAIHREIMEETSLHIKDVRFVEVQDCIRPEEFFKPAHFVLLNFTALVDSSEVKLNEEADAFKWVTVDEALQMNLNQPSRRLIQKVFQKERIKS